MTPCGVAPFQTRGDAAASRRRTRAAQWIAQQKAAQAQRYARATKQMIMRVPVNAHVPSGVVVTSRNLREYLDRSDRGPGPRVHVRSAAVG